MNMQPSTPTPATPLMSEKRVSIIGALLIGIGPISMSLFTPAMPEIAQAFSATESVVKLTLSLYFAGFALAQLVCGPLSDGFGRKPIALAFMGVYLVASALAVIAPSVEVLIVARFFQGIGAAVGVAISRAIVRDLFTNERSARIMNLMSLILGIGPAFAPTLGGVTMELLGWHAIFVVMLVFGIVIMLVVQFALVETVERDLSRIRPRELIRSYGQLFRSAYFMSSSLVMAGAIGAFYTLAVILPFILMARIGMSPTAFGLGMLMQSLSFFSGNVVVSRVIGTYGAYRIMPVGIVFIGIGSLALAVALRVAEPGFLLVMVPIAIYAFGSAFLMPAMSTASLAPFPHIAGAAAALSGFLQMGGGLIGGLLASFFGDPVIALATVVPGLGFAAIGFWLWWRTLPEPAMANVILTRGSQTPPPAS